MGKQLPTTVPTPKRKREFGKLHQTVNNDPRFSSLSVYHRVLIKSESGQFETLLLTDNELKRIRARSANNPEEVLEPTWLDKIRAL